jgi:hypothetical protein
MQYLLLLTYAPVSLADAEAPRPEEWSAYTLALQEAGIMVSGAGLQGVDVATTVRVRAGERLLTDGPFADTKELIGGFATVECADLDEALDVASAHPAARYGSIEIRPLREP